MIKVKALGSLGKILGDSLFTFERSSIELVAVLKSMFEIGEEAELSKIFSEIIITVNGVALSRGVQQKILESGDEVTLIPITHGG